MRALRRLGHEVCGVHTVEAWQRRAWLARQAERRLQCGLAIDEINRSVVEAAKAFQPDLAWAEKQEFLRAETIEAVRKLGGEAGSLHADPYFSVTWKRTPIMDEAIALFDVLVYCKSFERDDYQRLGKPLVYMPLGYCDEKSIARLPRDRRAGKPPIGFLGGWEPRRETLLHAVAATGLELKIWGGYWEFLRDGRWSLRRHLILRQLAAGERFGFHCDALIGRAWQGGEVYGDDYASALTAAKIGLGFLRKAWPDQHTTRTFEIPACGSLLLADRTGEHQEFFAEGKEAEFFDSEEELIDKARFYCANETSRAKIAAAGFSRCRDSGYSYLNRLRSTLPQIMNL